MPLQAMDALIASAAVSASNSIPSEDWGLERGSCPSMGRRQLSEPRPVRRRRILIDQMAAICRP